MVVPIRLLTEAELVRQTAGAQLLQGLIIGLSAALFLFSLFNAVALRDLLFVQYAVMIASVTVFFSMYYGLGQQYLWTTPGPLVEKIAPLAMLLMLSAASPFVAGVLRMQETHPRLHAALYAVSITAAVCFGLSVVGVLDYRTTQLISSSMGPIPLLLAMPVAISRVRSGDDAARWLLLGWGVYLCGALTLTALLRGALPAGFWTQHAFQFATTMEMIMWVRVLSLRLQAVRRAAERADVERSALLSMAETDSLTSLPNRRGLLRELEGALGRATAEQHVAVYMLDLNGFKPVNDRLGHEAGDDLLIQVARRLRGRLRARDVVARLGGDEFVIVSAELRSEADAFAVGNKLQAVFHEPFEVQGHACKLGASIGFALALEDGCDPAALLRRADSAMYAGKEARDGSVRRDTDQPTTPLRAEAASQAA
jgi:diguanylate cyclase